ncbi:hypothetical protein U9M48_038504 [Paspalum notatum var. saurae]|uniref:DUF7910 domain-containing protein n=1 Tax=Paspalum notatum var. saurae TaxID=547442 RepID=A0AAQ3XBP4_PASNO
MRRPHAGLLVILFLSALRLAYSSTGAHLPHGTLTLQPASLCAALVSHLTALVLYSPFSIIADSDFSKVRAVNLGGWLVVEGWIKPSLFDGIPNRDMLDGTQVQLKSVGLQKYVSAGDGGGGNVTVDRDAASSWETFKVCCGPLHFRNNVRKVDKYYIIQVTNSNQLTSNYPSQPGWDNDMATFEMTVVANNLHGDYQLANGYGPEKAKSVLSEHRKNFVTGRDFYFISQNGINAVRIPVGWWIAYDPDPPAPFVGGSLNALDRAFYWAQ